MRRLSIGILAVILVLAATVMPSTSSPAEAGAGWCRTDPIMLIQGNIVDIFVTAPLLAPLKVTGPNQIVVATPPGIDSTLLLAGPGFGRGEKVQTETAQHLKVNDREFEVEVRVYVPARSNMDIGVEFAPNILGILSPDKASGNANEWVTLRTTLPKLY